MSARRWILNAALVLVVACGGEHEGPGEIAGGEIPSSTLAVRQAAQGIAAVRLAQEAGAEHSNKQILFGDLHVHTTFSADAFLMSMPMMQGEGAHPVADACDFARHCSAVDFWSINDHAEALTARRWKETVDTIRACNEVSSRAENPDVVAFLGWEWTQIGQTPEEHYGHKNVILRDLEDGTIPRRPIHSAGFTTRTMREPLPWSFRWGPVLLDWSNRQRYLNGQVFQDELRETRDCEEGVDTRKLPLDCMEGAATPEVLYRKLREWGSASLVIPHGTTWGIYTPQGSTWDKQLSRAQHDEGRQTLVEVYSGHGNSEEYRPWRGVEVGPDGSAVCPQPRDGYEACCWRAGEIIRSRCDDASSAACEEKVEDARRNFLAAGTAGRFTVPGAQVADWQKCGSCPDCFLPSMGYRPGGAVQYMLAISNFDDPEVPRRFHFGFLSSSDNHRARPGTGYKEYGRLANTEASGPRSEKWHRRINPLASERMSDESRAVSVEDGSIPATSRVDFERQASFFMTGGLAAVHADGRSREQIWQALERREVYGTSGPRILLWFDLLNGPDGLAAMGSKVAGVAGAPRFRVRALGSFVQKPGCPDSARRGLSAERLAKLCRGECYHPSDERRPITRIEVVRIRPQLYAGEDVAELIDDPWRIFACPGDGNGCIVEFSDDEVSAVRRPARYYVRAIEKPSPAVNAGGLRCRYDWTGECVEVDPCYGDYRTPYEDDCLAMTEERAWSSPIYIGG